MSADYSCARNVSDYLPSQHDQIAKTTRRAGGGGPLDRSYMDPSIMKRKETCGALLDPFPTTVDDTALFANVYRCYAEY
jgi:hypothetical protein